ncbi:MAG TPA: hypothetical protein VIH99_07890, partial [Bdellovibrionota bacterium]
GRKCLALTLFLLAPLTTACSPNSLMKPDCHSCTVEEQEWKDFTWTSLVGRWRGSVENMRNLVGVAKKAKTDKRAELNFVKGDAFMQAHGGSCTSLPAESVVLNGLFWESASQGKEYEAFVPVEDGKVAYGRVSFEKMNGKELCHFRRFGRVMGKNRLDLPTVSFSDKAVATDGRALASANSEQEFNVEFLRFAWQDKATKQFSGDGRGPASVKEQERPALILRVFRVDTKGSGSRSEWSSTEEYIYRLWKAE